ncbi:nucleotide-binding alpha-beta plait domain-containing protein, partial [Tanacetum coccineum]
MFGFVRFIKIFDVDRLVNNLCTIWVGRFKLHANIERFQRPPLNKNNSQSSHNKGDQSAPKNFYKESGENVNSKSYAHVVNAGPHQFHKKEDSPAIVLDETYANKTDYSLALLGKVNDFTSLTNLNVVLANEDVQKRRFRSKVDIGYGLLSYFKHLILSRDERVSGLISRDGYLHSKRVYIKTTLVENIYESFKVIIQGKTFWIRAKEVSSWMPDFEEDIDQDRESVLEGCETSMRKSKLLLRVKEGGLAQKAKKDWVRELCEKHKVNFVSLQETKMEDIELSNIKLCWGNFGFEFIHSPSVGNSGGEWAPNGKKLIIISVYAPQELHEKKLLWDYLILVLKCWNGDVIIMGDFNEVRTQDERHG